jgi:hypothetical protein
MRWARLLKQAQGLPARGSASHRKVRLAKLVSHWQLGIEAQELTTAIGLLAQRLESEEPDERQQAITELEAALLADEGNKQALAAKADATCWVIEHLCGQAAYRQQQARRLNELSRSDASRADSLEESLVLVLTRLQPAATRSPSPTTNSPPANPRRLRSKTKTFSAPSGSRSKPSFRPIRPPSRLPSRPAGRSQAPS